MTSMGPVATGPVVGVDDRCKGGVEGRELGGLMGTREHTRPTGVDPRPSCQKPKTPSLTDARCRKPGDHGLPRRQGFTVALFLAPKQGVRLVFCRKQTGLIRAVAHHRRCGLLLSFFFFR